MTPHWQRFSTRGARGLTICEGLSTAAPARPRRQGSGHAAVSPSAPLGETLSLPPGASWVLTRVSLASSWWPPSLPAAKSPSWPYSPIPVGSKSPMPSASRSHMAAAASRSTSPRFISPDRAHFWACKHQHRRLGSEAVL